MLHHRYSLSEGFCDCMDQSKQALHGLGRGRSTVHAHVKSLVFVSHTVAFNVHAAACKLESSGESGVCTAA